MTEERDKGTTFDAELHDMGGDIGPASIRGSGARPGGRPDDDAEPKDGYAVSTGYVAGRDDDAPATAGSDEKEVAARTDEVRPDPGTAGVSPHPVPEEDREPRGHGGDPAFRVRGPVDETTHGEIMDDRPEGVRVPGAGHVGGDLDWVASDEDDPDGGSGRTDADDGGYLPGEGTGRPRRDS